MNAIDETELLSDCETLHLLAEDFADETIDEDVRAVKLDELRRLVARLNAELN